MSDNICSVLYGNTPVGIITPLTDTGIYECELKEPLALEHYCSIEKGIEWIKDQYCSAKNIVNVDRFVREFEEKNKQVYPKPRTHKRR